MLHAALLIALSVVAADAPEDEIDISVRRQADLGEKPVVSLTPHRAVAKGTLSLKRDDGKVLNIKLGKLKAGETTKLPVDQGPGRHTYAATLTVHFADKPKEPATLTLDLDLVVIKTPKILLNESDFDLAKRTATLTMTHATRKVRYTVIGEDGNPAEEREVAFEDVPAGTRLPITWTTTATVLWIEFVGYDPERLHTDLLEVHPFSLAIPHEEVVFASGQSAIQKEEQPKIDDATAAIQTAVGKYGKLVDIKLFVIGHTDTVGTAQSNQALSQARAESISRAFRTGGVRVPIHFQGLGEDRPRVLTPDETDELRNRRAEYILSVEPPGRFPKTWKKL